MDYIERIRGLLKQIDEKISQTYNQEEIYLAASRIDEAALGTTNYHQAMVLCARLYESVAKRIGKGNLDKIRTEKVKPVSALVNDGINWAKEDSPRIMHPTNLELAMHQAFITGRPSTREGVRGIKTSGYAINHPHGHNRGDPRIFAGKNYEGR